MAIYINSDDCINCGACEPECPNNAIYEGGSVWTLGENQYEDSTSPGSFKGSGNQIFISSFRINVPNARHFMMNLNAQRFAQ
jgi:ferredoxin